MTADQSGRTPSRSTTPGGTVLYPDLTVDEKRSLLVTIMEDIRGAFDLGAGERTQTVIALAAELGYEQVRKSAQEYADLDEYRDGRWFRRAFADGGYEDPPFPVIRMKAEARPALVAAIEDICEYPEYRLSEPEDV